MPNCRCRWSVGWLFSADHTLVERMLTYLDVYNDPTIRGRSMAIFSVGLVNSNINIQLDLPLITGGYHSWSSLGATAIRLHCIALVALVILVDCHSVRCSVDSHGDDAGDLYLDTSQDKSSGLEEAEGQFG